MGSKVNTCCISTDCSNYLHGVPMGLGLAGVDLQDRNASCIADLGVHLSQLGCGEEHQNLHGTRTCI